MPSLYYSCIHFYFYISLSYFLSAEGAASKWRPLGCRRSPFFLLLLVSISTDPDDDDDFTSSLIVRVVVINYNPAVATLYITSINGCVSVIILLQGFWLLFFFVFRLLIIISMVLIVVHFMESTVEMLLDGSISTPALQSSKEQRERKRINWWCQLNWMSAAGSYIYNTRQYIQDKGHHCSVRCGSSK